MNETLKLMMSFCADDVEEREWTHKPFVYDGYLYATDGCIMVRTTTNAPDAQGIPETVRKTIDTYFGQIESLLTTDGAFKELSSLDSYQSMSTSETCQHCKGEKSVPVPCDNCTGTGRCICSDCEDEHECQRCAGEGDLPEGVMDCPSCGGKGIVYNDSAYKMILDDNIYNTEYLEKILDVFPNVTFAIAQEILCFTNQEFDGVLMGYTGECIETPSEEVMDEPNPDEESS